MKLTTYLITLAAILALPVANAASLQLQNFGATELRDNAGNPLANGGFLGLYAFGAGDGAPPSDVAAAVANGSNGLLNNTALDANLNGGTEGSFFASMGFANDGAINGQNLYLMFGDGGDAASSTQIGLVNLNVSPNVSDSPPPGWVSNGNTLSPAAGDVVIGNLGAGGVAAALAVAIPEPSSSLMIGLAGLAFFIRRKR